MTLKGGGLTILHFSYAGFEVVQRQITDLIFQAIKIHDSKLLKNVMNFYGYQIRDVASLTCQGYALQRGTSILSSAALKRPIKSSCEKSSSIHLNQGDVKLLL